MAAAETRQQQSQRPLSNRVINPDCQRTAAAATAHAHVCDETATEMTGN